MKRTESGGDRGRNEGSSSGTDNNAPQVSGDDTAPGGSSPVVPAVIAVVIFVVVSMAIMWRQKFREARRHRRMLRAWGLRDFEDRPVLLDVHLETSSVSEGDSVYWGNIMPISSQVLKTGLRKLPSKSGGNEYDQKRKYPPKYKWKTRPQNQQHLLGKEVQVAVAIIMPSPRLKPSWQGGKEVGTEFFRPGEEICIGLAKVPCRGEG